MSGAAAGPAMRRPLAVLMALACVGAFVVLITLGTWQVQRMYWKQDLLATIDQRVADDPHNLSDIETRYATTRDVDYWPVTVAGTFEHGRERHYFATWRGHSGFHVFTPLRQEDGRALFVNRGFVPYDRKDAARRAEGQVEGAVEITGLARNADAEKPSFIVPDNDPDRNVFHWKDRAAMAESAGLDPDNVLPFFVDADDSPNPGGLPGGGVTRMDLPDNHLQYAITWYGLAAALVVVLVAWGWRNRRGGR
jgi:surfeit locus 1 family protein